MYVLPRLEFDLYAIFFEIISKSTQNLMIQLEMAANGVDEKRGGEGNGKPSVLCENVVAKLMKLMNPV